MDQLSKQVRRVQGYLYRQQLVQSLPWCWFAALVVAAGLVGLDKYRPLPVTTWGIVGGALGVGLLAALGWSYWRRRGAVDAAIEIDRRFGLKERVSTMIALGPDALETPAGAALLRDVLRRVASLDLGERFKVSLSRWSWIPLIPAIATVMVALFVDSSTAASRAIAKTPPIDVKQQVQNSSKHLQQKLAETRKAAREEGLKDAEELLARLERDADRRLGKEAADKKQALVKLNDLARELQERREKLARSEQLQQQFQQLKNLNRGPADKFAQALRDGDFKRAIDELDRLQKQLKNNELADADREKLARQLQQMKEQLDKLADAQREARQKLEQQLAEAKKAGARPEAEAIQRQLDALNQQMARQQRVDQLAQKLGQCAQCMQQGNSAGAREGLAEMKAQLEAMQTELAEAELLESAMDEITEAKEALNCKQCNGEGCPACRGMGDLGQRGGRGLGRGRGAGERPEERGDTQAYDSAVKQKVGPGAATVVGEAEGANIKGGVQQEIQAQMEGAKAEAADPLTGQRLPKAYEQHTREYFDGLREGPK